MKIEKIVLAAKRALLKKQSVPDSVKAFVADIGKSFPVFLLSFLFLFWSLPFLLNSVESVLGMGGSASLERGIARFAIFLIALFAIHLKACERFFKFGIKRSF
ncbi:MAG: hypothetical protein QG650_301 [Patescibacteria group bacterium]|nr:hypothetical protein [Patescibacteria group bacterium]